MAKIVVADDDEDVRNVLAIQLRVLGHQVTEVDTGRSAVLAFGESRPDLILCDLNMPEGDGWWVLDAIKATSSDGSVPVIIITGDQSPELEREALRRGACALFRKPWLLAQLRQAISNALDGSSVPRSNVS